MKTTIREDLGSATNLCQQTKRRQTVDRTSSLSQCNLTYMCVKKGKGKGKGVDMVPLLVSHNM